MTDETLDELIELWIECQSDCKNKQEIDDGLIFLNEENN